MASKTPVLLKKSTSSTSGLIAILMTVCTFVLVFSFLFSKELIADIKFNQKVITEKNKVNATLKSNVDSLDELKNNFESLNKEGPSPSKVLQALPTSTEYASLSDEYEAMAGASGARLSNIALDTSQSTSSSTSSSSSSLAPTVANTDSLQKFRFRISVTGTYASLQQLTQSIQKSLRPTRIETVNISGSEPSVTADFVITTYFQPRALLELPEEVIQ